MVSSCPSSGHHSGGIAVVAVDGDLYQHTSGTSLFGSFFSPRGTLPQLVDALRAADVDPEVRATVLRISSSGGTVAGVAEAAAAVREAEKPVAAYVGDSALSAAWWIASPGGEDSRIRGSTRPDRGGSGGGGARPR